MYKIFYLLLFFVTVCFYCYLMNFHCNHENFIKYTKKKKKKKTRKKKKN